MEIIGENPEIVDEARVATKRVLLEATDPAPGDRFGAGQIDAMQPKGGSTREIRFIRRGVRWVGR